MAVTTTMEKVTAGTLMKIFSVLSEEAQSAIDSYCSSQYSPTCSTNYSSQKYPNHYNYYGGKYGTNNSSKAQYASFYTSKYPGG